MRAEATFDHGAETLWSYPVLALLSEGYPDLEGRLPTYYSPVRRFTHGVAPTFSRDLHVLGTPPAFVLSQDQTLHLNLPTIAVAMIEVDVRLGINFDRRSRNLKRGLEGALSIAERACATA